MTAAAEPPVARHRGVWTSPPGNVPTQAMPDGPLLGNGDVGVVVAGPPQALRFHISKNDFWSRTPGDARILTCGTVTLQAPELAGASYRMEQDLHRAEAVGTFARGDAALATRTWVSAGGNLLVTRLTATGKRPLTVTLGASAGPWRGVASDVEPPPGPVTVGRELHGGGRWYFHGAMADLRIVDRALTSDEIRAAASSVRGPAEEFDGKSIFRTLDAPKVTRAVTVAGWVRIDGVSPEANYIVSSGEWNRSYSLGLSAGKLRWTINGVAAQSEQALPLGKWIHVAGVFDGRSLRAYLDGRIAGQVGGFSPGACDAGAGACWFERQADTLPGKPRRVAVVSRVVGAATEPAGDAGLRFTVPPGKCVTVATSVLSDLDADPPLPAARRETERLTPGRIAGMAAAHRAWWRRYWGRSFVEIPDKEIEKRWYGALYVLGSCSRAGKVAPGLWGSWVTTDEANWHGDFHLNYNFQAPYYLAYSANQTDLTEPFYRAVGESLSNGRAMAARHGWKGVHFPVCIGPWGLSPEDPDGDWGQRSNAAFAALNFIWQWHATHDRSFLRRTAYPYLLEVAAFWEDYLKFEEGRYVIYSDSIHEGSGPDVNPVLSLGLLRTLFGNLPAMSEELGVDAGRRAKWRHISEHLSAFPLQERGGKTVFRYSERGMAWCDGNTLGIHHIFPAGAIGLDSDPATLRVCRDTIDAMARWADYNGFASWYSACARVGYDPETILSKMREECDKHSMPNLLLYYGGGGIESVGGLPAVNEMLMQSHDGVLRLFPCWPKRLDARFGTLRARGAFLVSAGMKGGTIGPVCLTSEKGRPCTIVNPWPGRQMRLIRNGTPAEALQGDRVTFATTRGETLELRPGG